MPHPMGELALLVPRGRDAAIPERLADLEAALTQRDVRHHRVQLGDDPVAAVHDELAAGTRLLVVCGSERAVCAVVPALFDGDAVSPADVVLGLFPGGAPNDFAKTFGLTLHPEAAAVLLSGPRVMRIDVGVVTCRGPDGAEVRRLVLNEAVVGLGAEVVRRTQRLRGLGRVGALLAWWMSLARYRARHHDVDMTFAEWHAPLTQVRLSNGQYAVDGLHVAPLALPDDGAWDVQVWDGPKHLPFTLQPQMIRAEHLPHPHISQWRQRRVAVTSARPSRVAVDEQVVGTTPATFTILEQALRLKI